MWKEYKENELTEFLFNFFRINTNESSKKLYFRYITKFIKFHNEVFLNDENSYRIYEITNIFGFEQVYSDEIIMFLSKQNYKYITCKQALASLGLLFSYLENSKFVYENPCTQKDVLEFVENKKTDVDVLTDDEIKKIFNSIYLGFDNCNTHHQLSICYRDLCIMSCFLVLGLKHIEVVNLNYSDVNFEDDTLDVGDRIVHFGTSFEFQLKKYVETQSLFYTLYGSPSPLFVSGQYNRMSEEAIRNIVRKHTKSIDKKITCETLRQTAINKMYMVNKDFIFVARYFGYDNLDNLYRVLIIDDYKNDDEAVLKMDNYIPKINEDD